MHARKGHLPYTHASRRDRRREDGRLSALAHGHRRAIDRVRAALTNAGFALPTGDLATVLPVEAIDSEAFDLPIALSVLLGDQSHAHLERDGWIAWGGLRLDGSATPTQDTIVNGLGSGPCVGRIWHPTDHVPEPDEDAVMSLIDVADLKQAWDVITFFAGTEQLILEGVGAMPDP